MKNLPDREFITYYETSLRKSYRTMIVGFILGGLCMACGVARLLMLLWRNMGEAA